MNQKLTLLRAATAALVASTAFAGSFTSDFSNPAQPGITLVGGSRANGDPYPAISNGVLALTYAEGGLTGSAFLDDLDAGQSVGAFTLNFKLRIGGGTSDPADGLSIYFGPDALSTAFGEQGPDGALGLVISFDTYDNGGGEAPAIDVFYGGNSVGHVPFTAGNLQSDTFSAVSVTLKSNGTLDLTYKGQVVYSNLYIPGYTPGPGRFSFGARTGGSYSNHWIDDLSIVTTQAGAPVGPTVGTPPASLTVDEHATASFSALPAGTPPFTIQWLRNASPITDATNLTYTITDVPAALSGSKYTVRFDNALGNITSPEATLTVNADVTAPTVASAVASETFNSVTVTFSENVAAGPAGNAANYSLDGGLSVSGVTVLSPTTVRLATSAQAQGGHYTLTVNNVPDTASTPNTIAANSTKAFSAWVIAQGYLKFEAFLNIGGTPIQGMLDDPKYQANTPDIVGFVSPFTSRSIFPDDSHENYGARISGFFTPATSGDYRFFTSSDDSSQLFLSSDSNPANLTQIAEETGCCAGFLEPPAAQTSEPVALLANHAYYIQLLYKEGGGGDYGQVAVRKEGATDPLVPIAGSFLSTYANPDAASINITQQPASLTGAENTTVTLSVAATGAPSPLVIQWQRAEPGSATFAALAGAVGTSYTTPILKQSVDNGAKYRAVLGVPGATVTSTEVTLTVNIDSTPPALVAAVASDNFKSVTLSFSEAMLPAGLSTPGNYSIPGLTVSGATALNATTVRLTTSLQPQGQSFTLTVSGVKDSAGNAVDPTANSRTFKSLVFVPGTMKVEVFTGIGGVLPSDLRASPKFPTQPDDVRILPNYELNGYGDNYGARIKGFFIPPTTADYIVYFATDDGGELYLSTDDSETNKKLIAVEPVWANSREWVATDSVDRRPDTAKIDPLQSAPNISVPVHLVAGQRYYTEIQYKEGGGGDHGEAKFVTVADGAPDNGTAPAFGSSIGASFSPDLLAALALPLAQRSDLGSGSTPGFKARVSQVNQIGANGLPTFVFRAEQQLAGLVDTNSIDRTLAADGVFTIPGIINWNQEAGTGGDGTEIGDFQSTSTPPFQDVGIPGIPGVGTTGFATDNIAAEVLTYVEFPTAGVYFMGVNSDDGFAVYPTDQPPANNLGLYVTAGAVTKGYYAYYGGTDKGGIFAPITQPLTGKLVIANPAIADTALVNADAIKGNIALIDRGVVTFTVKVQNALNAGAIGVVVVNSRDPDSADGKFPIGMGGSAVNLPAMMIEKPHGAEIKATIAAGGDVFATIAPDTTSHILGSFDAGRGSADTIFAFNVAQAGVYPLRLVWFEGGGGANLEWFTVDPSGNKVLVNDLSNPAALKAFRTRAFVPVQPTITATRDGSDLVLTFKGNLQSSDRIDGTFQTVVGTSPLHVPLGSTTGNLYYRAAQ